MRFYSTSIFLTIYILLLASTASAATFVVTSTSDSGAGSLREAVGSANLTPAPDDIVFDWTVFGSAQTITLTSGEILITQPLKILGPGVDLLKISGNAASRIFFLRSTAIVSLNNLTVADGRAPAISPNGGFGNYAGGIYIDGGQLYLSQTTLANCRAEQAGGIYNRLGVLHIINSTISGNLASGGRNDGSYGGGIFNDGALVVAGSTISGNVVQGGDQPVSGGSPGRASGGGINVFGGIVTITNSTIANNAARGGNSPTSAGAASAGGLSLGGSSERLTSVVIAHSTVTNNLAAAGSGGGQASGGGITNLKNLELYNVTISGNQITSSTGGFLNGGGGIWNSCSGCLTLTNTTVVNNAANNMPGGGVFAYYSFRLRNSIIANNTSSNGPDVYDIGTSLGNNLIGNNSASIGLENGVNGDRVGTPAAPLDPLLAPLAANGGATLSHLPLAGSPAVNNGSNCVLQSTANGGCLENPLTTDQRGYLRLSPPGGFVDIGAVEYGSTPSLTVTPAAPDLQSGSDLGVSSSDNLTASRAPVFDVAGVPAQATVELLRNGVVAASVYSAAGGTVSLTDAPPANGVFQYTSRVTAAGASGAPSAPLAVTIDTVRPTVTVNQTAGQADPTDALPITFIAEFSKPVDGLNGSDVSFAGSTAGTGAASVAVSPLGQNGTQYLITVGNLTATGLVRVSLPAGAASDAAGNTSAASTGVDNTVSFNLIIEVAVEGRVSRSSGVVRALSVVTLTDNQTGAVYSTIANQFGYFRFRQVATYQQTGRNFTASVQNKTFPVLSAQIFVNNDRRDVSIIVP